MEPIFFSTPLDFRNWLAKNHQNETELLVGYFKVNSGKPSITWSESVDEALCYGWIDGVRKSIDEHSYMIRFTPRKPTSIWSNININKVAELTKKGLMKPAGITAYKHRKEEKSGIYSFEIEPKELSVEFEQKFMENEVAWNFFIAQAPSYKKVMIHWIMNAKQTATQISRLEKTILASEKLKRVN
ncbi:MAG: YdeI/OmpD-associated family protein [Bacteroidia bacterium]